VVEADEMFQNAGEKGDLHADPIDPPRRRANKKRGHGTYETDRPPVAGAFGRESGEIRLEVLKRTDRKSLLPFVEGATRPGATVNTDEWKGYGRLSQTGRAHHTVNHSPKAREWARDDDQDGVREVHVNTAEGIWTGLRNFLRPFRGVHKRYLNGYVAVFEWAHNLKEVSLEALRQFLRPVIPSISFGP
jgi:transposase-like protein